MTAPTPRQLRADIDRRAITRPAYARLIPTSLHTLRRWMYAQPLDEPIKCHATTAARLHALIAEPIDKESQE